MSGHSKWANIKNKKAANDKVKGVAFAKLTRIITLSVIEGGGIVNPDANFKLRLAIDKARAANMPKENIQRAIEKGHGPDSSKLKEAIYEAFGPHGAVYIIQCATDNPTRTHNEVRGVVEKRGGKMGNQGSVGYLFQKCAVMQFDLSKSSEDVIFNFGQALKAYDIDEEGETITVYFPFDQFGRAKATLGETLHPKVFDIEYKPLSKIQVSSEAEAKHIIELAEAIEELDDVHNVFSNLE
ncbi:MAG: YebC/PmpR family DNA-binding transcriptional regulator [bacterium]